MSKDTDQTTLPGVALDSLSRHRAEELGVQWAEQVAAGQPVTGVWPRRPAHCELLLIGAGLGGRLPAEARLLAEACDAAAARRWLEIQDASASRQPGGRA